VSIKGEMKFAFLCVVLIASVCGHAIVRNPMGWNTNPSTTSPCGAGTAPTSPDAIWKIGSTVIILWQVVAADGVGEVTMTFDPTGQQNFVGAPVTLIQNIGAPNAVAFFNLTSVIPSTTCTGPNSMCTVQFKTSSNWFSCTSVQLVAVNPPPVNTNPTCEVATGLAFCSELNGQFVSVPHGQTPATVDSEVSATYPANLYNPNVFTNGNSSACAAAYKTFLCHNSLPYCGTAAACQTLCYNAINTCKVTPAELGLYPCASGPISCCQNGTLPCNNPSISNGNSVYVPIHMNAASSYQVMGLFLFAILVLLLA